MNRLPNACLLMLVALSACHARAQVIFDRWYIMTLDGQRAGYSHTRIERDRDTYRTQVTMHMTIRRGTFVMDITHATTFVETLQGQPVEATTRTNLLNLAVRYTFEPGAIVAQNLHTRQRQTLPALPGPWLAPAAASRQVEQRMKQGDKHITVRTLDVTLGPKVVDLAMTIVGQDQVQVLGRVVPAIVWEAQSSAAPGVRVREYVDQAGRPLKSRVDAGGGLSFEMIAADQALATANVTPPQIMAASLIQPDRPIAQPRQRRQAIYHLTFTPRPGVDLALPDTSVQQVQQINPTTFRVTIHLDQPTPRALPDRPRHLQANQVLDHEDPRVVALAKPFVDAEQGPRATAQAMRDFVRRYVTTKDLSVGLATASQVAATRQGDCTEHAVLLAAMLRQANIPSRVVSGLVYTHQFLGQPNVFAYHMWTQAWLPETPRPAMANDLGQGDAAKGSAGKMPEHSGGTGGRWVDLDATLKQPFDATHIALRLSTMADQTLTNDLVGLVPMLSGLGVQVIQVGGRKDEMAPSLPDDATAAPENGRQEALSW